MRRSGSRVCLRGGKKERKKEKKEKTVLFPVVVFPSTRRRVNNQATRINANKHADRSGSRRKRKGPLVSRRNSRKKG